MPRKTPDPADVLSTNLKRLMEARSLSDRELANRAQVDHKTIGSIREKRHSPNLGLINAVANALGLAAWQLLRPSPEIAAAPPQADVDRLIELFYRAPPGHRQTILNVANSIPVDENPTSATDGAATRATAAGR